MIVRFELAGVREQELNANLTNECFPNESIVCGERVWCALHATIWWWFAPNSVGVNTLRWRTYCHKQTDLVPSCGITATAKQFCGRCKSGMLKWDRSYETSHPDIDREHRAIFEHLNEMETAIRQGAGREHIVDMIVFLQQYTLVHFSREEAVMACTKCPSHGANCAAHRHFEDRLEGWMEMLSSTGTPVSILEDIHSETCRWIENHIGQIDIGLRVSPRLERPALEAQGSAI